MQTQMSMAWFNDPIISVDSRYYDSMKSLVLPVSYALLNWLTILSNLTVSFHNFQKQMLLTDFQVRFIRSIPINTNFKRILKLWQ